MQVTVDDVNFGDVLECVYILSKKSRASTARELPDKYMGFLPDKTWLLITCDTVIRNSNEDSGSGLLIDVVFLQMGFIIVVCLLCYLFCLFSAVAISLFWFGFNIE